MLNYFTKKPLNLFLAFALIVTTASSSFYIPLKVNDIDPLLALNESYEVAINAYSDISSLTGTVAIGIKDAAKNIVKNKSFNFFSIQPQTLLQLTAPFFNLLPITSINPIKKQTGSTSPKTQSTNKDPLKETLDTLSSPLRTVTTNRPEDALVNIFCSQKLGKLRRTITGSGILINKDGTVLTNAHVAEFPLLSETNPNIVCLARYGNPASGALSIKVIFISPEWVKEYGKYINTEGTPQTGKSDFAILKLQTTNKTSLLPMLIEENSPEISQKVYATAYPADILGTKGVDSKLSQQKESLNINDIYSVGVTQKDIIETNPSSIVGQRGSSGGALSDEYGHLVGIIAMTVNSGSNGINTNTTNSSKKNIRVLSISHINSELTKYSGVTLKSLANKGSTELSQNFDTQYRSHLSSLLSSYLK